MATVKMISIKTALTSDLTIFLPLERACGVEILQKMPLISLYWFAVQQQSSRYKRQVFFSLAFKFMREWSELTSSLKNLQKVAQKVQKLNNARKT